MVSVILGGRLCSYETSQLKRSTIWFHCWCRSLHQRLFPNVLYPPEGQCMVPRKERSLDKLLHILEDPTRRRILESPWEKDLSFNELGRICSNHGRLGYHMRQMREIVKRVPNEKMYRLTQSGRVAWDWYAQAPSPNARGDLEPAPVHVAYANQLGLNEHAFALYEGADSRRPLLSHFWPEV